MSVISSRTLKRIFAIFLVILLLVLILIISSAQVQQLFQLTTAPKLPDLTDYDRVVHLSGVQNWDADPNDPDQVGPVTHEYHHKEQGTSTFPVPYSWLMALEAPARNLFTVPFSSKEKFMSNDYILKYGFVRSKISELNPEGLPIGITRTKFQSLPGVANKVDVAGFTCAACHTGQIAYGDSLYIIEGAPASADFGNMVVGVGAALGQTLFSSYVPLLNGRWERFVKNTLGTDAYTAENEAALQKQLFDVLIINFKQPNEVTVVEGYTRLDALNRIGNRVFAIDADRFENYAAVDAPVNYPPLWTTGWFKWVQYDASIMRPLVRNVGEAMGVYANFNIAASMEDGRFSSSIPLDNLFWMEDWLTGKHPLDEEKFQGLLAPKWPDAFPQINMTRAGNGERLYKELCVRCHLPPVNGQLTTMQGEPVNEPDYFGDNIWNHFEPISWWKVDEKRPGSDPIRQDDSEPVLKLKVFPLSVIGTDPATGSTLESRHVDTAGSETGTVLEATRGMQIKETICTWEPEMPPSPWLAAAKANTEENTSMTSGVTKEPRLVSYAMADNPNASFALSLGAIVQSVIGTWFDRNNYPPDLISKFEGNRPNCLQSGKGYKARPHDGVWATAPYLHNGSVPTLWDMLSPVEERPDYVILGDVEFDAAKVGVLQPENYEPRSKDKYNADGFFVLDTTIPGNKNTGHEFKGAGDSGNGVIGRGLSDEERWDLIEYLKTL
jgi:hypothetical protein